MVEEEKREWGRRRVCDGLKRRETKPELASEGQGQGEANRGGAFSVAGILTLLSRESDSIS